MSPTVLLVDDDIALTGLVSRYLHENGFVVSVLNSGANVVQTVSDTTPDLLILDVMLPEQDGLSICREVRSTYAGQILMLTALGDDIDEVAGLELGADDYLVKPVRPRVLLARIRALLRRGHPESSTDREDNSVLHVCGGQLSIDKTARDVLLNDKSVSLTDAEFELLHLMAANAGTVLGRDRINQSLRGLEHDGVDRSIDLRVSRLRKKLQDTGREHRLIKSVRGKGYLLPP